MTSQGKTDNKIDGFAEKIESIFSSCHLINFFSELLEKNVPIAQKQINVPKRAEQFEAYENSTVQFLFLEHA